MKKANENSKFVYREVLSNGLCVLVHEMPYAQSVCARLLVAGGPRYENKHNVGAAHYLEHMLFEGSRKYPTTRQLRGVIESKGGDFDAYTVKEYGPDGAEECFSKPPPTGRR